MTRTARAALLVTLGIAATAASSEAGGIDLFGGYSYTRRTDEALHGVNLTATWGLSGRLGLAADVGHHRGDIFGLSVKLTSLMAGPRIDIFRGRRRVFVRAMGGGVRTSESPAFFDGAAHSETTLGLLAGGGLDWDLGERWGVRLSGDYYRIQADVEPVSQPRASLGLSYRFGGAH
jgi:opacity protein-like surface antigen